MDRLHQDIDANRASIARTVGELGAKVNEAVHWETYVTRYPGPALASAAVIGLVVGRALARNLLANGPSPAPEWASPESRMEGLSTHPDTGRAHRFAPARASWQRLSSRVEGIVNRMIDEVVDAAERALVPAVVGGVQTMLEGGRRPISPERASTASPRTGA